MGEVTGKLEDWCFAGGVYFGRIYGDSKGRFPDGASIRTSYSKSPPCKEGDVVVTRNSRYLLGKPAGLKQDPGE